MDKQLIDLLQTLATQLGTTTEYLWAALVQQAPVSALISTLQLIAILCITLLWTRLVHKKVSHSFDKKTQERVGPEWTDDAGVFFSWVSVFVLINISLICICSFFSDVITALVNPEYWALQNLLGMLNK